jgi:hypothetical protein
MLRDPRSATLDELVACIDGGDEGSIIEAAREVGRRLEPAAAPALHQVLERTDSARARNAVALALSDMKDASTFDLLVTLLNDPRTDGARGTLLYCLTPYDCGPILPMLVSFVVDGNFEVAHEAMSLIRDTETTLNEATWQACVERIRLGLRTATEERRPLLDELLHLFE